MNANTRLYDHLTDEQLDQLLDWEGVETKGKRRNQQRKAAQHGMRVHGKNMLRVESHRAQRRARR